jgi:nitrate reductase gamma subunit
MSVCAAAAAAVTLAVAGIYMLVVVETKQHRERTHTCKRGAQRLLLLLLLLLLRLSYTIMAHDRTTNTIYVQTALCDIIIHHEYSCVLFVLILVVGCASLNFCDI